MEKIIPALKAALEGGRKCMLVTVVKSSGSVPRGPGACMLVDSAGAAAGTVGGGALELQAVITAQELLTEGRGAMREYQLGSGAQGGLGMVCGGSVVLHFRCISPDDEDAAALACATGGCLSFELQPDGGGRLCLTDEQVDSAAVHIDGGREIFTQPVSSSPRAFIFGGGHVARALVPVLSSVGFRCTVLESRPGFLTQENFAAAENLIETNFDSVMPSLGITERDYIVIMTYGHESDYVLTRAALETPARYIGVLGSRAKAQTAVRRLRQDGLSQEQISRVVCPVGLPIGGPTPEEIAVSITAQMIAVRHGK